MSNVRTIDVNYLNQLETTLLNTLKTKLALQNKRLLPLLKANADYQDLEYIFEGILELGNATARTMQAQFVLEQLASKLKNIAAKDSNRANKIEAIENVQATINDYLVFSSWKKSVLDMASDLQVLSKKLTEQKEVLDKARLDFNTKYNEFNAQMKSDGKASKVGEFGGVKDVALSRLKIPEIHTTNSQITDLALKMQDFNGKVNNFSSDIQNVNVMVLTEPNDKMEMPIIEKNLKELKGYQDRIKKALEHNKKLKDQFKILTTEREGLEKQVQKFKDDKAVLQEEAKNKILDAVLAKREEILNRLKDQHKKTINQKNLVRNIYKIPERIIDFPDFIEKSHLLSEDEMMYLKVGISSMQDKINNLKNISADNQKLLNFNEDKLISDCEKSFNIVKKIFKKKLEEQSNDFVKKVMEESIYFNPLKIDTDSLDIVGLDQISDLKAIQKSLEDEKDKVDALVQKYETIKVLNNQKKATENNKKVQEAIAAIKAKHNQQDIYNLKNAAGIDAKDFKDTAQLKRLQEAFEDELKMEIAVVAEDNNTAACEAIYQNAKARFGALAYTLYRYQKYDEKWKGSKQDNPEYTTAQIKASRDPEKNESHLTSKIRIKNTVMREIGEIGTLKNGVKVQSYTVITSLVTFHKQPSTKAALGAARGYFQSILDALMKFTPGLLLWSVRGHRVRRDVEAKLDKVKLDKVKLDEVKLDKVLDEGEEKAASTSRHGSSSRKRP